MPWLVKLTQNFAGNPFRSEYFPRSFHYKKDAQTLIKTLEKLGGRAFLEKK